MIITIFNQDHIIIINIWKFDIKIFKTNLLFKKFTFNINLYFKMNQK